MKSLRIKKLCNAFVPDAEMIDDIPILSRTVVKAAKGAVDRYKSKHGGLWVGGSVLITDDGLAFAPTGINIDLHRELSTVLIMREEIKAVRRDFGWLTGIVTVTHTTGEFRFRCFGAKTVVDRIAASFALDRRYAE